MAVGKSRARIYVEHEIKVRFDDVAGLTKPKKNRKKCSSFCAPRKDSQRRLLVGAPGTGNTLLATTVAGEANVPFFSLSGSEFVKRNACRYR